VRENGEIVSWGDGGSAPAGLINVRAIYSSFSAYAVIKNDGCVQTWGHSDAGGVAPDNLCGVISIQPSMNTFAAVKYDGSVLAWGGGAYGDATVPAGLSDVARVYSNGRSVYVALTKSKRMHAWGYCGDGCSIINSAAVTQFDNVVHVCSTVFAFAALSSDGRVLAWGPASVSWRAAPNAHLWTVNSYVNTQLSNVAQLYGSWFAFVALHKDGTITAFGSSAYGGTTPTGVSGVVSISATGSAFAALSSSGAIRAFGFSGRGADGVPAGIDALGVTRIYSTERAFAALCADRTIRVWVSNHSQSRVLL